MQAGVETLYEDDTMIILRIYWYMGGVHGENIITKYKSTQGHP